MDTNYRERMSFRSALILLAALACGFSIISILISDLFVAVSTACLTVLYLCERRGKKTISLISTASIVGINVIFFVLALFTDFLFYNIAGVQIIVMSLVLYVLFKHNVGKGKTVLALFSICLAFFALSLWLLAASYTETFSPSATFEFYRLFVLDLRADFAEAVLALFDQLEGAVMTDALTEEFAYSLADSIIAMLPSFFVIAAVAVVGITCKIFTYTVYRMTGNSRIYEWKFVPHSAFAYVYSVLFVLYVIFTGRTDVFSIVIVNLAIVLMCVYAYYGFGFATALLSMRHTRGFAWSIIVVGFIVATPITFVILSFFGVAFNILYWKRKKMQIGY